MKEAMKKIIIYCSLLLSVSSAVAVPTAEDVIVMYDNGNEFVRGYVGGFAMAMMWVDVENEYEGKDKIFCIPENLTIDDRVLINAVKKYLKDHPYGRDNSFNLIGIQSFKATFPCK